MKSEKIPSVGERTPPKFFRLKSPDKGFALVATLLMMVLLSLLGIGMLSLSAITLRSSSGNDAMAEARANARLALMLAIGELQESMGPDQRISITADQLQESGGDGSTTSAADGNRHWTGVYRSWLSTSDERPAASDNFEAWLISGDPSLTSQERAPVDGLTGANTVELVGSGTLGGNADRDRVVVPSVDVNGGKGRYAWWVGDQGVKAAIAPPLPPTDNSLATTRNNMQVAPHSAIGLATIGPEGHETKPFGSLAPDDARLPKVISWPSASFLASSDDDPSPLFHDLAARSTGLLTNVRKGGFRKDLSMMMENFTAPPDLADPANILYTVRNNSTGKDEVGINFMELWAYYHLYKQLRYGNSMAYTTSGSISADVPLLQAKNTIADIVADHWDMFKHPIVIRREVLVSFEVRPYQEYDQAPPESGASPVPRLIENALFVTLDPIMTLWNPLDVPVHIQSFKPVNTPRNMGYLYTTTAIPYDINLKINNGVEIPCAISGSIPSPTMDVGRVDSTADDPIVLKPGEVVMFSQAGTDQANTNRIQVQQWSANFSEARLRGKKGFNFGGGMSAVLRDNSNSVNIYNQKWTTQSSPPLRATVGRPIELQPDDTITYSLSPNSSRDKFGLYHSTVVIGELWDGRRPYTVIGNNPIDYVKGHSRAQVGDTRASRPNNYKNFRADNTNHSDLFPEIDKADTLSPLDVTQIIGRKEPIMSYSVRVKSELENDLGTKMLARFNPKAHFTNFYDLSDDERDMLPYEIKVKPVTSFNDAGIESKPDGESYFGSSLAGSFGSSFVVTHSVPRQPLVSLAAFQHSFANGFNRLPASGVSYGGQGNVSEALARYPLLPQISHAIGNSLAPSIMPSNVTEFSGLNNNYPHPVADHSYLANRELWDDYFLSGITPQPSPAFTTARDQATVAMDFYQGQKSLPVARYLPELGDRDAAELAGSLFSGGTPTPESIRTVARHLIVDGMFNVNSTSEEAWKAVLGSLKNRPVVVRDEMGVESIKPADGDTPIANIHAPADTLLEDASPMQRDANWNGRRVLKVDEIDALAEAIVKEVRKRGPFLSLADFVNRRVGDDVDLARAGAIQNALDSDEVPINRKQNQDRAVGAASRFEFPEAEEGAMHYGSPSLVKQGDILTPIAPILSARSDSFIIRAYGESQDAAGNIVARAWCEAVVERSHDYVNPTDAAETLPAGLSPANQEFGRKFEIVSFRWLNPGEI